MEFLDHRVVPEYHKHLLLVLGMNGMEGMGRCSFQRHARMGRDLLHERKQAALLTMEYSRDRGQIVLTKLPSFVLIHLQRQRRGLRFWGHTTSLSTLTMHNKSVTSKLGLYSYLIVTNVWSKG